MTIAGGGDDSVETLYLEWRDMEPSVGTLTLTGEDYETCDFCVRGVTKPIPGEGDHAVPPPYDFLATAGTVKVVDVGSNIALEIVDLRLTGAEIDNDTRVSNFITSDAQKWCFVEPQRFLIMVDDRRRRDP